MNQPDNHDPNPIDDAFLKLVVANMVLNQVRCFREEGKFDEVAIDQLEHRAKDQVEKSLKVIQGL